MQSGKGNQMKRKTTQPRSKSSSSIPAPGYLRSDPYLVVSFSELP